MQFGFGATGLAAFNRIAGNQWCGPSNFVATAVLLFEAQGVTLFNNAISGNADVGIYSFGTGDVLNNNRLDDVGPDCSPFGYDYGIGNWGVDGVVTNNKVGRGFDTPYDGVDGGKNKVRPGSSVGEPFFKQAGHATGCTLLAPGRTSSARARRDIVACVVNELHNVRCRESRRPTIQCPGEGRQ